MIQLTSAQEAAFNAAGEAMLDLADFDIHLNRKGGEFVAFGYADQNNARSTFVSGEHQPTAAQAVAIFIAKVQEERTKPRNLTTAREAIEAVKQIIGADVSVSDLERQISELPIA